MGQQGRAVAAWQRSEIVKPPNLDGKKAITLVFESKVTVSGNKRNPTSVELGIWKRVLIEQVQEYFGWAEVDKISRFKADGDKPALRAVTIYVPHEKAKDLREVFDGADFDLSGAARVQGLKVLGEIDTMAKASDSYPEITPL